MRDIFNKVFCIHCKETLIGTKDPHAQTCQCGKVTIDTKGKDHIVEVVSEKVGGYIATLENF